MLSRFLLHTVKPSGKCLAGGWIADAKDHRVVCAALHLDQLFGLQFLDCGQQPAVVNARVLLDLPLRALDARVAFANLRGTKRV